MLGMSVDLGGDGEEELRLRLLANDPEQVRLERHCFAARGFLAEDRAGGHDETAEEQHGRPGEDTPAWLGDVGAQAEGETDLPLAMVRGLVAAAVELPAEEQREARRRVAG